MSLKSKVMYNKKVYEITAINSVLETALYKNGDSYIVATENRMLLQFFVTPEIMAKHATKSLGYKEVLP